MKLDPNRVVQKLSMQIATQAQQIAILQTQLEQLQRSQAENEKDEEKAE